MAHIRTVLGADDARGYRGVQSKRAPEREYPVSDLHSIGIPKLGNGQVVIGFDLDDREIGVLIEAHHAGAVMIGIAVQCDLNLGGLVNHVVVREDETLLIHDDARTQAALRIRRVVGRIKEAVEEILKWIVLPVRGFAAPFGLFDHLRCGDIDHRRTQALRDARKSARKADRIGNCQQRSAIGRLRACGHGAARYQRADDDSEAEREGDEERREEFPVSCPEPELSNFDPHPRTPSWSPDAAEISV